MLEEEKEKINIYWANLCVLNRMEKEKMEVYIDKWKIDKPYNPEMIFLGDTEEITMYEKMDTDMARGELGFDLLVSSRFDLFCSGKYLQNHRSDLFPIADLFPVREKIRKSGAVDTSGLFYPLVVLPHYIIANTKLLKEGEIPHSLEDLLDDRLKGKVFVGSTELPSAKSMLFAIWYKFGKEGLETCVKNWHQKNAPSAVRHGLVKNEVPVSLLPGIFAGPGSEENLVTIRPLEGSPVLPSYLAVRRSEKSDAVVDFISNSVAKHEFIEFYRDQGMVLPSDPGVSVSEPIVPGEGIFFPHWDWILDQDMEYFDSICKRISPG